MASYRKRGVKWRAEIRRKGVTPTSGTFSTKAEAVAWAACDAYNLRRNEYVETAGKTFRMEYFLKFALSKTGKLVLMVSCHI